MGAQPLAIVRTGMVSSVGLDAPAACAAIRVGLANPTDTRFLHSGGEWVTGHAAPLDESWRGRERLAHMAAMVIEECLAEIPREDWNRIPLLLCVAEPERPGRWDGLNDQLFTDIRALVGANFAAESLVVPQGRVSAAVALTQARNLLYQNNAPFVLVVGTDSLLSWPTLRVLDESERLLTNRNSNGFMPGEAAAGVLVGKSMEGFHLRVEGLGFGEEAAHVNSDEPSRAEGLTRAIKGALADAGCEMHDLDFRITDISGEQYYFKEAALALSRTLRKRKEEFDLWHPAECIGETGSAIGLAMLAVADAACRKAYAAGPAMVLHTANDAGQRAALILRYAVN